MAPHAHIEIEHALPGITPGARFHRWVTLVVGLAAAAAGVLAYAEAESNRQKELGFVQAAGYAEQIFVRLGASSGPAQFEGNAGRTAVAVSAEGRARVVGAKKGQPFDYALAVAKAHERASNRLLQTVKTMTAVPASGTGLDARTAEAVRSSLASAGPLLEKQNAAVEHADTWATRQERTIFALGLVAIAAALGGLAGLMGVGRPGRVAAVTGTLALLVAVGWSGITFLT